MHVFIDFWKLETENSILYVFNFLHKLISENSFCFLFILDYQTSFLVLKIENCFWKQKIRGKNNYQIWEELFAMIMVGLRIICNDWLCILVSAMIMVGLRSLKMRRIICKVVKFV